MNNNITGTYEEAEKRLKLLEKNPYAFTTDNEESVKLQANKDKKLLKIKSVGDSDKLKCTLDSCKIDFLKFSKNKGNFYINHAQCKKKYFNIYFISELC